MSGRRPLRQTTQLMEGTDMGVWRLIKGTPIQAVGVKHLGIIRPLTLAFCQLEVEGGVFEANEMLVAWLLMKQW